MAGQWASPFFDGSADETVTLIRGGAPKEIHFLQVSNVDATDYFLQLFDASAAGDVNLGTTTPTLSLFIPAGDGTKRGAFDHVFPSPISFHSGIVYAVTTTATGSSGPTTALVMNAGLR